MKLSCGIVGLPNVGKSTLFNALLKKQTALVANYPFATIDPNVGVVEVPDERLPVLAKIVKTQKIVPAVVEFYDIAGLVKGASKGEGLGNQFLSHIREVAAIVHVVRIFEEKDIIHVENKIDPKNDLQTVEEELMLADLQTLDKQKEPKGNATKDEIQIFNIVKQVREKLDKGVPVRSQNLTGEQSQLIKHLNLLTAKPVIYCFNCSLEQLENKDETLKLATSIVGSSSFLLFNPLFDESLDEMIKKAYETLGLISFLTAGEKEVRAWTITQGTTAPQAAGVIHTDFAKHFIKAEVVTYENFIKANGWNGAKEQGLVQTVGRDYIMQEGDVVDFKVNA
jgi:small GTP-binding protein